MDQKEQFRFRSSFASDVGGRADNEDAYLVDENLGLFIVADGMGGCDKGEVASWFASEHLATIIKKIRKQHVDTTLDEFSPDLERPEELLRYSVLSANHRLYKSNEELLKRGGEAAASDIRRKMGTTLVSLLFQGNKVYITHVGDSRAYRVAEGSIQMITRDHSWVEERVREGVLTPAEARTHEKRNIITRSVGFKAEVEADIDVLTVYPGDRFLLCSDGLSNVLKDNDLLFYGNQPDLQASCNEMVGLAKKRGGKDNITVVLVEVAVLKRPPETSEESEEGLKEFTI